MWSEEEDIVWVLECALRDCRFDEVLCGFGGESILWSVKRETISRSVARAASTQEMDLDDCVGILSLGVMVQRLVTIDSAVAVDFMTLSYIDMKRSIVGKGFPAFDVEQRSENMLK